MEKYCGHLALSGGQEPLIAGGLLPMVQEKVYEGIKNRILSGVLEPGRRLFAEELAAEMGAEGSQVREALLRLKSDSLADFHPSRGFIVASFTMDDLSEIYFLRSLLEGAASELAARNLSDSDLDRLDQLCQKMDRCLKDGDLADMPGYNASFHEIIYQAAKSPRLYGMIVSLWNGFLKSSLSCLTLRARETVDEHRAIYQALRDRSPSEAGARTREHIVSVLGDLSEYWGEWLTPVGGD